MINWVSPEDEDDEDHDAPEEIWGGWSDNHVLALFNEIFDHIPPELVIQIAESVLETEDEVINLGFE